MKKTLRLLFGRFGLIAFALILQVLVLVFGILYLEKYFYIAQIVMSLVGIVTLVSLEYRSMPIEAKLSWAVVIIVIPVFGSIVYVMFSKNYVPLKHSKLYCKIKERNKLFNTKEKNYNYKFRKVLGDKYFNQCEYIWNINEQKAFQKTKTKFYPSGEAFFEDYLNELKNAKEFIFIEYFIIAQGKMLNRMLNILDEKVEAGVEVRIIYDDIGSINYLPAHFARKMRKKGYKCYKFTPFVPFISSIHNNRDHRKITIIDGKVAFTGGLNIADEYINVTSPLGYWHDTALRIEGEAVDEFTEMFLTLYNLQTRKIDDLSLYTNKYDKVKSDGVVVPYGDGPRPLYLEYVAENIYLNLINGAEKSIYITTPYLIIDNKVKNALELAALKGVDVRIFTPHIPDKKLIFNVTRSFYQDLIAKGVKIYEFEPGFIHSKQFLVDDEVAIVGTINLDYRSLVHHYECGCLLYKTSSIIDIKKDFDDILSKSIDMKDYKQSVFMKFFCKLIEIFQPLM
ncbi:MAG: cardiolipin synthase [Bacillales bacterium]|nr:cardiolipin synthase [Bacillales bacterium]